VPVIHFTKKNRKPLTVEKGVNLMQALLAAEVPVASSCHGDAVCAKCRVTVSEGLKDLAPPNEAEKFLADKFQLKSNQRISCQIQVNDDLEIDTGYW
jgi:ferredoxin, 2Fe-2S